MKKRVILSLIMCLVIGGNVVAADTFKNPLERHLAIEKKTMDPTYKNVLDVFKLIPLKQSPMWKEEEELEKKEKSNEYSSILDAGRMCVKCLNGYAAPGYPTTIIYYNDDWFYGAMDYLGFPILNKTGLLINQETYEKFSLIVYGKPWEDASGRQYLGYDYESTPYPFPDKGKQ